MQLLPPPSNSAGSSHDQCYTYRYTAPVFHFEGHSGGSATAHASTTTTTTTTTNTTTNTTTKASANSIPPYLPCLWVEEKGLGIVAQSFQLCHDRQNTWSLALLEGVVTSVIDTAIDTEITNLHSPPPPGRPLVCETAVATPRPLPPRPHPRSRTVLEAHLPRFPLLRRCCSFVVLSVAGPPQGGDFACLFALRRSRSLSAKTRLQFAIFRPPCGDREQLAARARRTFGRQPLRRSFRFRACALAFRCSPGARPAPRRVAPQFLRHHGAILGA